MKKFMTIAMVILAAAMLMVSCEAKSKVEDHHVLSVEVGVGVAESKALVAASNAGDGSNTINKVEITVLPKFKSFTGEEISYGKWAAYKGDGYKKTILPESPATEVEIPSSIELGYISQGLWQIDIVACHDDNVLYKGGDAIYFTESNTEGTITLEEDHSKKQNVVFQNIVIPTLVDGGTYTVEVSIDGKKIDGTAGAESLKASETVVFAKTEDAALDPAKNYYVEGDKTGEFDLVANPDFANIANYYEMGTDPALTTWGKADTDVVTFANVASGTHIYSVVLKRAGNVVGGYTNTIFVPGGDTALTVSGQLNPANFTDSKITITVNAYKVEITGVTSDPLPATVGENGKASAAITLAATVKDLNGNTVTNKTLKWKLNTVEQSSAPTSLVPGIHHIAVFVDGEMSADTVTIIVNGPAD